MGKVGFKCVTYVKCDIWQPYKAAADASLISTH